LSQLTKDKTDMNMLIIVLDCYLSNQLQLEVQYGFLFYDVKLNNILIKIPRTR